jgi:transcriptional regulator with XRE-family HTH domain
LRKQRTLAELSLRDLAAQTQVSNAYLSQIERGLHQPSIRVLRALAEALKLPPDLVLAHAGLLRFADDAPIVKSSTLSDGPEHSAEAALLADPKLTRTQKQTLIAVYRSYLYPNSAD